MVVGALIGRLLAWLHGCEPRPESRSKAEQNTLININRNDSDISKGDQTEQVIQLAKS
jgi:hypothetical protein